MQKWSLRRMLIFFMIMCTVLTVCTGLYVSATYYRGVYGQTVEFTQRMLDNAARRIEQKIQTITSNLLRLSEKRNVMEYTQMDRVSRMDAYESVKALLDSYAETESCMRALFLYSRDGSVLRGHSGSLEDNRFQLLSAYKQAESICSLQTPRRSAQYIRLYPSPDQEQSDNDFLYAVVLPVLDMDYCGALVALIDTSMLMQLEADAAYGMTLLCDGEWMWHSDAGTEEAGEAPLLAWHTRSAESGIYSAYIDWLGWEIRMPLYLDGELARAKTNLQSNLLLLLAVLAMEGAMLVMIYYSIVQPIQNVAQQMKEIGVDGEHVTRQVYNPRKSRNEIEFLTRGINGMLLRVENLSRQVMQSQIDYLNARIVFLQSQINPHFLFNSLSTIRGMAAEASREELRDMTECVAQIYRYCIDGDTMSDVRKEVECVQWYVRTFNLRYGEIVQLSEEIEQYALPCAVPRMMLQPLVENALLHGFIKRKRPCLLRISCRREGDFVLIEVENNGENVRDEQLARMNGAQEEPGTRRGIGIANVRSRIELLGGSSAYLRFSHREGGGVIACIRFPARRG